MPCDRFRRRIIFTFFPSLLFGLASFHFSSKEQAFKPNLVVRVYSGLLTFAGYIWIIELLNALYLIVGNKPYFESLMALDYPAEVQEYFMAIANLSQQWLYPCLACINHWTYNDVQIRILNGLLHINKDVGRLAGTTNLCCSKYLRSLKIMKGCFAGLEVFVTIVRRYHREYVIQEYELFALSNQIISGCLSLSWTFINLYLIAVHQRMKEFLIRRANRMTRQDYRRMSMLFTRIYRVKRDLSQYYGLYMLWFCFGLIRVIMFLYFGMTCVLFGTTGTLNLKICRPWVALLFSVGACVPLVGDFFVMTLIAECLVEQAKSLRRKLLRKDYSFTSHEQIDIILVQERLQDLQMDVKGLFRLKRKEVMPIVLGSVWNIIVFMQYTVGGYLYSKKIDNPSHLYLMKAELDDEKYYLIK